mgnify:CR=1 FL=1
MCNHVLRSSGHLRAHKVAPCLYIVLGFDVPPQLSDHSVWSLVHPVSIPAVRGLHVPLPVIPPGWGKTKHGELCGQR